MRSTYQLRYDMRLSAAVTILFFLLGCGHLARASECRTIRFNPGATSAKIQGAVQPEDQQCFRFGTGKGQSVRLAVQSKSGNVAFTINDVADNRDRIEFTSEKKVYELIVYQNLRSVTPDDFTLSLSIR